MEKWIEVKYRSTTEKERGRYGEDVNFLFDCKLPEDGQNVIIATNRGAVHFTKFFNSDRARFAGWDKEGEVLAWMPLPTPFFNDVKVYKKALELACDDIDKFCDTIEECDSCPLSNYGDCPFGAEDYIKLAIEELNNDDKRNRESPWEN